DVHRILGQREFARALYAQVVEAEPHNAAALVDLGDYYFHKNDFGRAVGYFKQAAQAAPRDPMPLYDLSLAYSEAYLFDESRDALTQARALGESQIAQWMQDAPIDRVVARDGGVDRAPDIRRALEALGRARAAPARLELWRKILSLLVALLAV